MTRLIYTQTMTLRMQIDRQTTLKRITTRGLSGLANLLGRTCYLNAVIQALANTDTFLYYMLGSKTNLKNDLKNKIVAEAMEAAKKKNVEFDVNNVDLQKLEKAAKDTLSYELFLLLKYMWSENSEVVPRRINAFVDNRIQFDNYHPKHNPFGHRDSDEAFDKVINKIIEETASNGQSTKTFSQATEEVHKKIYKTDETKEEMTNKLRALKKENIQLYLAVEYIEFCETMLKKSYSRVHEIFTSVNITAVKCAKCFNETYTFNNATRYLIPIPTQYHAQKSVALETLLGQYFNDEQMSECNGNQYSCNECNSYQNALKRDIIFNPANKFVLCLLKFRNDSSKIKTQIIHKHELDLTPYCLKLDDVDRKMQYRLYAAIRHNGTYDSGHYYAFCRNPINELWFWCNDGDIVGVDNDEVLKSNSYMLFYEAV